MNQTQHQAFEPKVIQANGLTFWTENFGHKEDPAILLVMGSGAQGLLWHQKFCERLANEGFFVIRYDHRDVGLSSLIDYEESPYTILDMAKEAIAILDGYNIQKAHVVGGSLGGMIAMILGAHFPERVASLTLKVTTSDVRPALAALQGKISESPLSPPKSEIIAWSQSYLTNPPQTLEDQIQRNLEGGRINNGPLVPFDEGLYHQLVLQGFLRMRKIENSFNHLKAMEASYDLHQDAARNIKAPTLILHGDQDPIFPLDHGEVLKQAIPHAQLEIIAGMGHGLNTRFYDTLIEKIVSIAKTGGN
jgi:pimeloyl-ACP methyl ester carboxylesterase